MAINRNSPNRRMTFDKVRTDFTIQLKEVMDFNQDAIEEFLNVNIDEINMGIERELNRDVIKNFLNGDIDDIDMVIERERI